MTDVAKKSDLRILCKYGKKCYQQNQYHLNKYKHDEEEAEGEEKTKEIQIDDKLDTGKRKSNALSEPASKKQKTNGDSGSTSANPNKREDVSDIKEVIKEKFGVEMPDDFYEFWVFCKSLNKNDPANALLQPLGLKLVGPFDLLGEDIEWSSLSAERCRTHHRHYYDPPEFMTLITSDKPSQYHMGYFRDDPNEMPTFVGSNMSKAKKDPHLITIEGDNLFAAVRQYILEELKQSKNRDGEAQLKSLESNLVQWCKRHSFSENVKSSDRIRKRKKAVVCKSFHGVGLVVPIHNQVGYRDLPYSDGELKKLLRKIDDASSDAERVSAFEPLQEVITLVQFANDECDYGMGLELGIDLFCMGSAYLHKTILSVLPLVYQLLGRDLYAEIMTDHLRQRNLDDYPH